MDATKLEPVSQFKISIKNKKKLNLGFKSKNKKSISENF